jgi:FkbM family methyltransferase
MGLVGTLSFILRHPLNRERKMKALARWASWQLGSRLVTGPVAVPFVNSSLLLVSPGMTGATGNVYTGLHEFEDMAFVIHLLRPGDLFVDVGANVGTYTVLGGAVAGANCVAVEPIKNAYERLVLNVHLNRIQDKVEALNVGIASKAGTLTFTSGLDTMNHVSAGAGGGEAVRVAALDEVLLGAAPTLLKIDVEGYEAEVVAGAGRVLASESLLAVVMELNGSGKRYGYEDADIHRRMLAYGFAPYTYSPLSRILDAVDVDGRRSANVIYVKDADAATSRLKSAPAFLANGVGV